MCRHEFKLMLEGLLPKEMIANLRSSQHTTVTVHQASKSRHGGPSHMEGVAGPGRNGRGFRDMVRA